MELTINKAIPIGDAGLPFNISIDVTYEQKGNLIIVFDWMEDASPYDNPPESWFERMKEIIADYFYEMNEDYNVNFE